MSLELQITESGNCGVIKNFVTCALLDLNTGDPTILWIEM